MSFRQKSSSSLQLPFLQNKADANILSAALFANACANLKYNQPTNPFLPPSKQGRFMSDSRAPLSNGNPNGNDSLPFGNQGLFPDVSFLQQFLEAQHMLNGKGDAMGFKPPDKRSTSYSSDPSPKVDLRNGGLQSMQNNLASELMKHGGARRISCPTENNSIPNSCQGPMMTNGSAFTATYGQNKSSFTVPQKPNKNLAKRHSIAAYNSSHNNPKNRSHQMQLNEKTALKNVTNKPGDLSMSASSNKAGLVTSVIENEQIMGFNVWGEKRLCLPHLLRFVLNDIDIEKIGEACCRLQITCTKCTPIQLAVLHNEGALPQDVQSCGLMRKSDAERLVKYLNIGDEGMDKDLPEQPEDSEPEKRMINLSDEDGESNSETAKSPDEVIDVVSENSASQQSNNLPYKNENDQNQSPKSKSLSESGRTLEVVHDCFGKQTGLVHLEEYHTQDSVCIECSSCKKWFTPSQFVGHTHSLVEVEKLSHWGFDSSNWRCYIRLNLRKYKTIESGDSEELTNAYRDLESFKNKFIKAIKLSDKFLTSLESSRNQNKSSTDGEKEYAFKPTYKSANSEKLNSVLANIKFRRLWAPNDGNIFIPPLPKSHYDRDKHPLPPHLSHDPPVLEPNTKVWRQEHVNQLGKDFVPNISLARVVKNPVPPVITTTRRRSRRRLFDSEERTAKNSKSDDYTESPWDSGSESLQSLMNSPPQFSPDPDDQASSRSTCASFFSNSSPTKRVPKRTRSVSPRCLRRESEVSDKMIARRRSNSLYGRRFGISIGNTNRQHLSPDSSDFDLKKLSYCGDYKPEINKALSAAFEIQRMTRRTNRSVLLNSDLYNKNKIPQGLPGSQMSMKDVKCHLGAEVKSANATAHSLPSSVLMIQVLWMQVLEEVSQFTGRTITEIQRVMSSSNAPLSEPHIRQALAPLVHTVSQDRQLLENHLDSIQRSYVKEVSSLVQENAELKDALNSLREDYKLLSSNTNSNQLKNKLNVKDSPRSPANFEANLKSGEEDAINNTSKRSHEEENSSWEQGAASESEKNLSVQPHKKRRSFESTACDKS